MMFEEIIGQDRAKKIIANSLQRPFIQNFLFTGPSGVGKRTTALILARILNCQTKSGCGVCRNCLRINHLNFPDLHLLVPTSKKEVSAEDINEYALGNTAPALKEKDIIMIDHVRNILNESIRPPIEGKRVVIVVNVQRMRYEAVSALLKIIEEQPNETLFILTTPQLNSVPDTIRSRCQVVRFNYLTSDLILDVLRQNGVTASSIVPGSPGETIRFVTSKFHDVTKKIFLRSPYSIKRYPKIINKLKNREYDMREIVQSLIYWYQLLLHARINSASVKDADIIKKTRNLETSSIVNSIENLLKLNRIIDFHPNKRLLVYNLLWALC